MKIKRVFLKSTVNVRGSRINELHAGPGTGPQAGVSLQCDASGNVSARWIHSQGGKHGQVLVFVPCANVAGVEYEPAERVAVHCSKCSGSLNGEEVDATLCPACSKVAVKK